MLMGIDGAVRTGQSGRLSRGGSSQLPRHTSSSHLPPRYPGQTRHTRQPEHQGKLVIIANSVRCRSALVAADIILYLQVLLFSILIIGSCTVVLQHKLFLPVSPCLLAAEAAIHDQHLAPFYVILL